MSSKVGSVVGSTLIVLLIVAPTKALPDLNTPNVTLPLGPNGNLTVPWSVWIAKAIFLAFYGAAIGTTGRKKREEGNMQDAFEMTDLSEALETYLETLNESYEKDNEIPRPGAEEDVATDNEHETLIEIDENLLKWCKTNPVCRLFQRNIPTDPRPSLEVPPKFEKVPNYENMPIEDQQDLGHSGIQY